MAAFYSRRGAEPRLKRFLCLSAQKDLMKNVYFY